MLPNNCNKKQAVNQGAIKLDDNEVCEIIKEVTDETNLILD